MTHLESLIAKAKAATPGRWRVDYTEYPDFGEESYIKSDALPADDNTVIGTGYHDGLHLLLRENDAEFIASCSPHLILALCELARAAEAFEERLKAIHDDPKYSAVWSSWQIHHGKYDGPRYVQELHDLSAKLAAVRGVNV
jgi:hypothetical protein